MAKKMKCIHCGASNFHNESIFVGAVASQEMDRLAKVLHLDYSLVLCHACAIGLALLSIGAIINDGDSTKKMISDSMLSAASKYFIIYNQDAANASFQGEHIGSSRKR